MIIFEICFASNILLDVFNDFWINVLQRCFRPILVSDHQDFSGVFGHVQNQGAEEGKNLEMT